MARLTKQMASGEWIIDGNRDEAAAKLAAYEDAEAQGRLLVLPCKLGGTLYRICRHPTTASQSERVYVRAVELNQNNFWRTVIGGEFGKTVFLTRKEARMAMKEGRDV